MLSNAFSWLFMPVSAYLPGKLGAEDGVLVSELDSRMIFVDAARAYIAWCHGQRSPDVAGQQREVMRHLACLYVAALDLPDCQDEAAYDGLEPEALDSALAVSFNALPFYNYWDIFNPDIALAGQLDAGDLADDLLDIYAEIQRGLMLFDAGQQSAAMAHWRFSFEAHWGRHATSALKALHCHAFL